MEAIQSWVSNHKLATLGKIFILIFLYITHSIFHFNKTKLFNVLLLIKIYFHDQTLNIFLMVW